MVFVKTHGATPQQIKGCVLFIACVFAFSFFCALPARAGFLDMDEVKEAKMGKEAAEAIIRHYGLAENAAISRRVDAVGEEVIKVCDRPELEYHFYVLNSDMINAFALPGGFIFVTTGIMDFLDDDDELASVLAHEVTHVAKKHGVIMYKQGMKDAMVNFLIMVLTRDPNAVMAGQMLQQSRTDIFGRGAENESDRVGLEYMYKAGYNPDGFMQFMLKMQRYESHSPDLLQDYFDSHPPMEERVRLVAENYRRLGLEPPQGLNYDISGRLAAMEICQEGGKDCYGAIEGPKGELMRIGDSGEEGSAYLRARKIAATINRLFDKKMGIYEIKKIRDTDGVGLIARNAKIAQVLKGDIAANKMDNANALADLWIENLKKFLWNDFLKEDL
jgi:hypothetical protein